MLLIAPVPEKPAPLIVPLVSISITAVLISVAV